MRGIHEAAQNHTFVGAPLSLDQIRAFSESPKSDLLQTLMRLTARRRQVLALVANGLTNLQIADALNISVATVATHVRQSREILGLKRRTQVARFLLDAQKPLP